MMAAPLMSQRPSNRGRSDGVPAGERRASPPIPGGQHRRVVELIEPLISLAAASPRLSHAPLGEISHGADPYRLHRFHFTGPRGGGDYIRIGLFAGLHGDEAAGSWALHRFLFDLAREPERAAGYELYVYPLINPTGYEDNTRWSRSGYDLNREFWKGSREPEVRFIETDLATLEFDGLVSLHSDDTSLGLYGFAIGRELARDVLEPALHAAEAHLPRNTDLVIDSFEAQKGIISAGYDGMLTAPPQARPKPFEIVFETPGNAPLPDQTRASVAALHAILTTYREMIAFGLNL